MIKPMLAATLEDLSEVTGDTLVSPKLDGFRCFIHEGVAYSRNFKPIRNLHVQDLFGRSAFNGLDGELVVGSPTDPLALNATSRGVTAKEGEPDVKFYVFDHRHVMAGFQHRLDTALRIALKHSDVLVPVTHVLCDPSELSSFEATQLNLGYEGIMGRAPNGPYKAGRATLREGYLWKFKRFIDGEGTVMRLEEGETNENEAFKDELGRTKRSTAKAGKVAKGMVGTIVVQTKQWGELRLQPGVMTHAERIAYWGRPSALVGKRVTWRAFGYGVKDKPRFARFYGVRHDL